MIGSSCYVCRSERVERCRLGPPAPDVLICGICGHAVRAEARELGDNLSIQRDVFDAKASAPRGRARWPRRHALIARTVNRMVRQPGRALDIGCSNGTWLLALGGGWDRHGVELSEPAAEMARRFASAHVHCGPFETFRAPPSSFDLVTAFALIEHLIDPRALVRWAFDHLKPGGVVVLMTGDRESEIALRMGSEWPLFRPTEHVHFFSARSLRHLLIEAGFAVIRTEWRYMEYPRMGVSSLQRLAAKTREVVGLLGAPRFDHLYMYARRPADPLEARA